MLYRSLGGRRLELPLRDEEGNLPQVGGDVDLPGVLLNGLFMLCDCLLRSIVFVM